MAKDSDDTDNAAPGNEADDDAQFADEDIAVKAPRSPAIALLVSIAALVVALAALAAVLFLPGNDAGEPDAALAGTVEAAGRQASDNATRIESVARELAPVEQSVAELRERVARMAASQGAAGSDIDALERRINRDLAALETVPARVASVERAMTTLRGVSTGAEDAWLLAQAEYFLQVANAELELAGNARVALRAMEMADERLLEVGDPGLTDIRRTLSAEMQSLESIDRPDVANLAIELSTLARRVDTLPLRPALVNASRSGEAADGARVDGLSGTDRAMATLKNAFSGAFSFRRTDEQAEPLIAPEAAYFLGTNLMLQLQAARLALLSDDGEVFAESLADAEAWLRRYYDLDDAAVREAVTTLNELRQGTTLPALPDASGSLRLLRQYVAFAEAGSRRPAESPRARQEATRPAEPASREPARTPERQVPTQAPEQQAPAESSPADSSDETQTQNDAEPAGEESPAEDAAPPAADPPAEDAEEAGSPR